ncbi:MAG: esterase-like activity of phytase family protein [Pseudomonadota bacterium]
MNRILTLIFALLFSLSPAVADSLKIKSEPITNFRIGSDQSRFGKLEFIGGLILTSKHENFGGISAIRFVNDNNFIAITDKARVITGTLQRKNGKPHKIKGEKITRIKSANGKTITGAQDKDSESIDMTGNQFLVGYERNDRIMRFNLRGRKLIADDSYLVDLEPFDFPNNKGPEAIAFDHSSRKLFAFAEYALNENGDHQGFVISGGKVERRISVKEANGFSLTDASFLPNGDLLMLERYYNPFLGAYMRIRRIDKADLTGESILDGEVLVDIGKNHEIDNMEGLAVSEMEDGSTRLTIVSDDNFSKDQRTLLLEFALVD